MPKKLIAKSISRQVDDLALEFDKKLTQVMINLSKFLKDKANSNTQKWAEIEKSKFKLQSYCCDTAVKFMTKDKILPKELKELNGIVMKLRQCMSVSFDNLSRLFISKEEHEVQ